jgi:hypothetical protein
LNLSKTELSNMGRMRLASQRLPSDTVSNADSVDMMLQQIEVVTEICESAMLATDTDNLESSVHEAKKWYADALRCAGRLSFSVQDVEAFEARTIRLEEAISELESRYVLSTSASPMRPQQTIRLPV